MMEEGKINANMDDKSFSSSNPSTKRSQPKQKTIVINPNEEIKPRQFFPHQSTNVITEHTVRSTASPPLDRIREVPEQENKRNSGQIKRIFILFILMNLFLNYDNGVIPASLIEIEKEIPVTYRDEALLGSLIYLGLSCASLLVTITFQKISATLVIAIMLIVNSLSCIMFSYAYNLYILYLSRLLLGFSQAFCVIYGPVWTNEFSPEGSSTKWMAILHSAVPLGIMLGYIIASCIVNYAGTLLTWRFAIQLQAYAEIPIAICFLFADPDALNIVFLDKNKAANEERLESGGTISHSKTLNKTVTGLVRMDTINVNDIGGFWKQVKSLLRNQIFIWVTLALCSIYFVVTGIQYWITEYLVKGLKADPTTVMISYSFCSITAPLCGVTVGSILADREGGYKGKNVLTAIKICSAFGILAFTFAIPLGMVGNIYYIVPLLWCLLFFGGALIPTATGVVVNCVPREYQATSSSLSQLVYNLGGYFCAPIVSAAVMDLMDNEIEGLKWGFRIVLWWSVFGMIFICIAWIVCAKDFGDNYSEMEEEQDRVQDISLPEIKMEILRRRVASYSF